MTARAVRLTAAIVLLAGPAWAAPQSPAPTAATDGGHPATMPTRDVDVTYATPRPGAPPGTPPLEQRMRWAAGEGKLRVDPPSAGLHVIMDYQAHSLVTLRDAEHTALTMDARGAGIGPGIGVPGGQNFVRKGGSEVAGLSCTQWETRATSGEPALVCLTEDGVLLRAFGAGRVLLEATRVVYGPIDPAAFRIPDDFVRTAAPRPDQSPSVLPSAPGAAAAPARPGASASGGKP